MTQLICGLLRLDGAAPDEALVRRMAGAMIAPRLASAVRLASRGPVAMAAVRLAARGAAAQPDRPALIEGEDGLLAADITVHDRARMGLADSGLTDAEFLWAALAERGSGAPRDLHGDFAFAAWRNGRLTLGRDHFGARPLVWTERPGEFLAFASTPAGLLRAGLASRALDEPVVATWIVDPIPPPGRTVYRDIRPVDAAHLVEASGGAATTRRYWRLDTRRRLPFDSDPQALAAETRRLLEQAVARRLPRHGPGAGHLSGGLDSSPLVVLGARVLAVSGRPFYGYTYREPDHGPGLPGAGDAANADRIAAFEPAISQVGIVAPGLAATYRDGIDPDLMLPVSPREAEEQVLRHAAALGATVVLSGWGGDQIVSYQGRGAELELMRAAELGRLCRALRDEGRATGVSPARLFLSLVVMQALPQRLREALRRCAGRTHGFLVTRALRARLVAAHRRGSVMTEPWPDEGDTHEMRRRMAEDWYLQSRLGSFAWQGARHGVAYAFPLLDLDLIEHSMQIPGIFLRNNGRRRVVYREALAGLLPDEVRLSREKPVPFPGEDLRIAAEREALLELCRQWGNNARIRDFLDLDFMAHRIRTAADPHAPEDLSLVLLDFAFQVAHLLLALDSVPPSEAGA